MKKFYYRTRKIVTPIFNTLFHPVVAGVENIPVNGSFILGGNHTSMLDIPLLITTIDREINFMAKKELFSIPVISSVFRKMGAFSIDRQLPNGDFTAIKKSIKLLKEEHVVGIFPEGTRNKNHEDLPFSPIAKLAILTKAPIVPFGISGSYKIGKSITLHLGEAIDIDMIKQLGNSADDYIKMKIKSLLK